MSRRIACLLALLAGPVGGCSLVWTPVIADGGPDAGMDASWREDGGPDAPLPDAWAPDAWTPDAWTPPVELCESDGDEEGDGLADCADSDCFGTPRCCAGMSSGGTVLDWDLSVMADREPQGMPDVVTVGSDVTINFRGGSAVRRFLCVPLAQGGEIELSWTRAMSAEALLNIVLSPSESRAPSGYLDELAVRVDQLGHAWVTEGGSPVALEDPGTCATSDPSGHIALPSDVTLRFELFPGVHLGRPALLATITVDAAFAAGCSSITLVRAHPILVEQLVRSSRGPDSCDETPGLWLALEGTRSAYTFHQTDRHVRIRNYECAAPGAFSPGRVPLEGGDFARSPTTFSGGIGAPDLSGQSSRWFLAIDGAEQDRNAERLSGIDLRSAIGAAGQADAESWPLVGAPVVLGPNAREPSYAYSSGSLVFSGGPPRAALGYEIMFAQESTAAPGTFAASTVLLERGPCSSLREPTLIEITRDLKWLFYRCDLGSFSSLGVAAVPVTGDRIDDILGSSPIARRVIAADIVTRAHDASSVYWAMWVLATTPGGGQELHLFIADGEQGTRPAFVPYVGNPVVVSSDPALCGTFGDCALTSFTVAHDIDTSARDRLRFVFARSRVEGSTSVHDLVALEQPAPSSLEPL